MYDFFLLKQDKRTLLLGPTIKRGISFKGTLYQQEVRVTLVTPSMFLCWCSDRTSWVAELYGFLIVRSA